MKTDTMATSFTAMSGSFSSTDKSCANRAVGDDSGDETGLKEPKDMGVSGLLEGTGPSLVVCPWSLFIVWNWPFFDNDFPADDNEAGEACELPEAEGVVREVW